jgi:hypothetical protein
MDDRTLAETFLLATERGEQAFRKLADDPTLHDSLAGFHAQQAVENALKAVLAHAGVAFRRTHDIAELLDYLEDSDLPAPPYADRFGRAEPLRGGDALRPDRAQRIEPPRDRPLGPRGHRLVPCSHPRPPRAISMSKLRFYAASPLVCNSLIRSRTVAAFSNSRSLAY